MKRTSILVAIALLFIGAFAVAEEAILVDFALLNADILADKNSGAMTQNRRTVMDYGQTFGYRSVGSGFELIFPQSDFSCGFSCYRSESQ